MFYDLKIYHEVILSYVYTYKKINYQDLREKMNAPMVLISMVVQELFDKGYFVINDNELDISEKAYNSRLLREFCSLRFKNSKHNLKKANNDFNWDKPYISNIFLDNIKK